MNRTPSLTSAGREDRPDVARVHNALLGGKDNRTADRDVAERLGGITPLAEIEAFSSLHFAERAIRRAVEAGIRQFIDVGTGYPLPGRSVHEMAASVHGGVRTAFTDSSRAVVQNAFALLSAAPDATVFEADVRNPRGILEAPGLREAFNLREPVAVVMTSLLHWVDDPAEAVTYLKKEIPDGSAVIISHASPDELTDDEAENLAAFCGGELGAPLYLRPREEIRKLFDGLRVEDPGVVPAREWNPHLPVKPVRPIAFGGVGFK